MEPNDNLAFSGLHGQYGWFARGDRKPTENREPFTKPSLKQIYDMWPFVVRYSIAWMKHLHKPEKLFINTYQPLKHKPYYGVPCGGIGCGSIGRDFRGGFCKFTLRPGLVEHQVDSNQFILNLSRAGETFYQVVLSAVPFNQNVKVKTDKSNSKENTKNLYYWDFSIPAENVTYRGLYPRSWTRFELPGHNINVICRQISPIIPGNYKDSSMPTTVFAFTIENETENELSASIAFTFRNGTGIKTSNGNSNSIQHQNSEHRCSSSHFQTENLKGVLLNQTIRRMKCTYVLSVLENETNSGSICTSFDPNGSGKKFWQTFSNIFELIETVDEYPKKGLGVAVCLRTKIAAHSSNKNELEFCLAWHMPIVHFGGEKRRMHRWYTRFFGVESKAAIELSKYALNHYKKWEKQIDAWQNPILNNFQLPNWFKSALFNELYFLTDGGSVWFDFDESWLQEEQQLSEYTANLMRKYGRFGYLESWEYRMINTYDVHFYASFALAELFPALEHVLQSDMRDQIEHSDDVLIKYYMDGDTAPRKTGTRVPHDLGNPAVDPWIATNAYAVHNTAQWKDLNLKFILTSYRDYYLVLKCDKKFLAFVWPAVKSLIKEGIKHWDINGDGMIENFGVADQTYDAWKMVGVSAYCGSLWIASLRAAIELGHDIDDMETCAEFDCILQKAKKVFDAKLWNGQYYNFDEGSACSSTIMADQLCGYWYLQLANPMLVNDLLPREHVFSALNTIYENNVLKFDEGRMGAVNGMRPDGTIERAYIQADEMWTGITYALSSFFIQQGDLQRGFNIAWGCYDACFNRIGLQYQTPEALYCRNFYRAIGYMRPLAIWSMFTALRNNPKILNVNMESNIANVCVEGSPLIDEIMLCQHSSRADILEETSLGSSKKSSSGISDQSLQNWKDNLHINGGDIEHCENCTKNSVAHCNGAVDDHMMKAKIETLVN